MNHIASDQPTSVELKLYTTKEVANILSVSLRTVQSWIRNGSLPHVRLGQGHRLMRIRAPDLESFIQQNYRGGTGA